MENKEMSQEKIESPDEKLIQHSESKKAMNGFQGSIVCAIILGLIAIILHRLLEGVIVQISFWILILLAIFCLLVATSCFFDWKTAKKIEKLEEDAKREEKEFSEINPEKRSLRAEKMFRMNQKELMRYYDMNLAQTKFLSGLGIMMIVVGVLIVMASLYMYISLGTDKMLLSVGSLSGIVVDFIGAIFIKMYTKNIEAAVKFHAKFAESNNLLLANSIAHKIDDNILRETTLSEIAKDIILAKKYKDDI